MASVFKNIAKGLLYVLLFPFGLIAIALYAVFGIFVFFFQFIRLIVLFFSGRKLTSDLPEDIEARRIIEANKPKEEEESPLSLYPSDSIVYGSGYVHPSSEQPEEPKEEPVEEDHQQDFEQMRLIDDEDIEEKEDDENVF